MNAVLTLEEAAVLAAGLGQLADAYTTYVGVYVQKTEDEDGNAFAKWIASNKYRLLLVKPLGIPLVLAGLFTMSNNLVATGTGDIGWTVLIGGSAVMAAVVGLIRGISNNAANKASKLKLPK